MNSIMEFPVKCSLCDWHGTVAEAEPDIDGEGTLGCPDCLEQGERVPVRPDSASESRNG